eukprot:802267-Pyramimonas_sp.AAC.1
MNRSGKRVAWIHRLLGSRQTRLLWRRWPRNFGHYLGAARLMLPNIRNVTIKPCFESHLQARFTSILLNKMAKIPMADEDIFSTTVSGAPKTDMLKVCSTNRK